MATNTKNFNFKKPDESDFYSIQDQNGNWDLADEELQKLNEPAFEDYTTGTSVPPAATALEALKSKIKLPIWMSNVVAFCKGCCTLAMIVNNCVSSDVDKPLAAAQGKVLQDQLTKLYSDFKAKDASLEIGQVEQGAYIYLRNKVTNNLLMLRLNEDDKKLVFNSEVDGQWGTETQLVTKSDLDKVAKIDRSTSSAWVGDKDNNMIFNCNFNNKTLTVTFTDGKTVTFQGQ